MAPLQVERVVDRGTLHPKAVHLPGALVDRVGAGAAAWGCLVRSSLGGLGWRLGLVGELFSRLPSLLGGRAGVAVACALTPCRRLLVCAAGGVPILLGDGTAVYP